RVIVSPVPRMVIGLVTRKADGPAGWGTAAVLTRGFVGVKRLTVPPRTAGSNTIVSPPGLLTSSLARVIASRRLFGPASLSVVTMNVDGTLRSSSASTAGRRRRRFGMPREVRTQLRNRWNMVDPLYS